MSTVRCGCSFFVGIAACGAMCAQTGARLNKVLPDRNTPNQLQITFKGGTSDQASAHYSSPGTWQVWRSDKAEPPYIEVPVNPDADWTEPYLIKLELKDPGLSEATLRCSLWTVQFNKPGQPSEIAISDDPSARPECKNTAIADKPKSGPFLAPAGADSPADISVSGSFIAGGGTKPVYSLELIAALYAPNPSPYLGNFSPGISAKVEINQAKTSTDRTTFDPDSIVAGIALQKFLNVRRGNGTGLIGIELDEALPAGEFSRADPSSNLIFGSTAGLVFKPIRRDHSKLYGTLFPIFGIETGTNLNKPSTISKVAVDLSHYGTIFRGYSGVDAQMAVIDKTDPDSDSFTLGGSYRVRLPVNDEPFVATKHQVTTIRNTTQARHWFELNSNWSPWSFKYLSLNAKYQYGELPPLFKLVDHSITLGLTFKAAQRNKPRLIAAP